MQRSKPIFILVVLSLSLYSCKVRLQSTDCQPKVSGLGAPVAIALDENRFQVGMITFKAKAELTENNNTQNFDVHFRMIEDSAVWVRVSALGIEGVRLLVERDSVTMINRLNRTYVHTSTDYLRQLAGVDFSMQQLQDFLVGNPLHGAQQLRPFDVEILGEVFSVIQDGIHYTYQVNDCNRLDVLQSLDKKTHQHVYAKYSDFKKVRKRGIVPGMIQVSHTDGPKKTELKLKYANVSTEEFSSLAINIPSRYANALE